MRRKKNKGKIWFVLGSIVLVAAGVIVGRGIFVHGPSGSAMSGVKGAVASSTAVAAPVKIGRMYVEGNTVSVQGKAYALLPASALTAPGSFAVEGKIVKVITDPGTRSQTPYYLLLEDNGSPVIVGIVVPAGDGADFTMSAFPVGTDVLVAGVVFPAVNPSVAVFDYSELLKGLHVASGIPQLNVPLATPYIGANFKNIGPLG